jgi:hypothetical protein
MENETEGGGVGGVEKKSDFQARSLCRLVGKNCPHPPLKLVPALLVKPAKLLVGKIDQPKPFSLSSQNIAIK